MFDIVSPKIESTVSSENYGRFAIEPLESGFGVTLGNALRRVLLSSLPGTAITTVKIEEVQHEFSTIPHVKEDTTEFLLNVKRIRLRSFSDRPGRLNLEASGEGRVTAADIVVPADFEIVNPELHLATLDSSDAKLTVEFTVERNKGYVPAGERDGLPIGVIPVDAIFTPIRKVNYVVEPVRIGQVSNYERLVLEIWTDGTIEPAQALSQSAQILIDHLQRMAELGKVSPRGAERQPLAASNIPARIYETPIEELDLSVRAYNCLKRHGITKVGQVLEMNEEDLLAVRNFGRKSLDELRERLAAKGFLPENAGTEVGALGAAASAVEERLSDSYEVSEDEEEEEQQEYAASDTIEDEEEEEEEQLGRFASDDEEQAEDLEDFYEYDEDEDEEERRGGRRRRRR